MNAVELHHIDPARNMRRFYRLDLQPDLFGGVPLVRQWGLIGAQGHIVAEQFENMTVALAAFARHHARKVRRGDSALRAGIADAGQIMVNTHESSINDSAIAVIAPQAQWC
jgi:predicted DNA-binding WGR domain protein